MFTVPRSVTDALLLACQRIVVRLMVLTLIVAFCDRTAWLWAGF